MVMITYDIEYKMALSKALGFGENEYKRLSPLVGCDEFKKIVVNLDSTCYKPGNLIYPDKLDSYDYCYLKSGVFKANLHVHSTNSDGMISIEKILNHSAKIADRLYEKTGEKFFLAVTDHDTLEGAKELIKKIFSDPDKYKNLKISAGVEISTIARNLKNLSRPLTIHTLVYCINPFDKKLNDFISEKARLKLGLAYQTVEMLNNELEPELKNLGIKFDIEEAAKVHEMVLKGQDAVCPPMRKYTAAKILFTYLVNELDLDEKCLSLERPLRAYKTLFKSGFDFCTAYKTAFEKYVSDVFKKEIIVQEVPENICNLVEKARSLCLKSSPKIDDLQPAFADFEETVKFIASLDYGCMSIAHPARIFSESANCETLGFYKNLFENFKTAGGESALCFEEYYGSYEGQKTFAKLDCINKAGKDCSLLSTGGLDSHGPNIITRWPYS